MNVAIKKIYSISLDCFSSFVWIFIISKVLMIDMDFYIIREFLPSIFYLLNYRFALILIFSIIAVFVPSFRKTYFYVIFFPIIAAVKIIIYLFHRPFLLIFVSPIIFELFKRFRTKFPMYSLAFISGCVVMNSSNVLLLSISLVILTIFIFWYLIQSLLKINGTSEFEILSNYVKESKSRIELGAHFLPSTNLQNKERSTEQYEELKIERDASFYYIWKNFCILSQDKISKYRNSYCIDLYMLISCIWIIAIVIITFAFIYLGISKIDQSSFNYKGESIWVFLAFSINTFMTASISSVSCISPMAQIFGYLELFCFIISVLLLFNIYNTTYRDKHKKDLESLANDIREFSIALGIRLVALLKVESDRIESTLEELFSDEQKEIVPKMKSWRGSLPLFENEIESSEFNK